METLTAVQHGPRWLPAARIHIAENKTKAQEEDKQEGAEIRVYLDGSGIDGMVGGAAVLYRDGEKRGSLRLQLGKAKHHTVYEGEGVGMILGLELIRREQNVTGVSMGVDNQAAITATQLMRPAPGHHIWDLFHKRLAMVMGRHREMEMTIRWTPGHVGIEGNEAADEEAKKAAQEGSSPMAELPAPLRKKLPYSRSAVKQEYMQKIKDKAQQVWEIAQVPKDGQVRRHHAIQDVRETSATPAMETCKHPVPATHRTRPASKAPASDRPG
ncbi:hypothetical protein B0H34DRAFT_662380 [Crassisporium funariophilum]|nr:hypothetical protein B0H34DRAFT_662380 [Crassisporium funariophilum]